MALQIRVGPPTRRLFRASRSMMSAACMTCSSEMTNERRREPDDVAVRRLREQACAHQRVAERARVVCAVGAHDDRVEQPTHTHTHPRLAGEAGGQG